jgi:hypothetical protein
MAPYAVYQDQARLLIRCLPAVAAVPEFALKGGTAINLFVQNMPRLSVDIDLTYLPIADRETTLAGIDAGLKTVADSLKRSVPGISVHLAPGPTPKLVAATADARIKVEPGVVARGSLMPPVEIELCVAAQAAYEMSTTARCLDSAELYGGKLCAALDRQHPRDLFDVMLLLATGPIPDTTRQAFVAYLAGHSRPMAELLAPNRQPIEVLFSSQFAGMTSQPIELADLELARTQLFQWAANALTHSERRFLLSVKQGEPDWSLLPFAGLDRWPAIQWKLLNVRRMSADKHRQAIDRLRRVLGL